MNALSLALDPLLDQPRHKTVLAERQPGKARVRAERMVEQREHVRVENCGRAAAVRCVNKK